MDFVVKAVFRVKSARVVSLLSLALSSRSDYQVVGFVPQGLGGCSSQDGSLENALNSEALLVVDKNRAMETLYLSREDVERALDEFASMYPRHFADFLNDKENEVTAEIFLQCCQGEANRIPGQRPRAGISSA